MRGQVSKKLTPFLNNVNTAINEAKMNKVEFTPQIVRANLNKLAVFIGQGPELPYVCDRFFKVNNREIPVRVYHPAPAEHLPVILHFHGGGHMCGSVDLYDAVSRKIANICHCIVICVEYRLAPEFPYPAGIDDCEHALINYQQVLSNLNFNDSVYILGDSAGGAICTTLTMNSLKNSNIKIDKQILIYPSVDYTMTTNSIIENGTGFLLEKERINWYFKQYFHSDSLRQVTPKKASPLHGDFSKKMPETLVITAGCDPLRDEGLLYIKALKSVEVEVTHFQFNDMIHAYMLLDSIVKDECDKTYKMISDFIK